MVRATLRAGVRLWARNVGEGEGEGPLGRAILRPCYTKAALVPH